MKHTDEQKETTDMLLVSMVVDTVDGDGEVKYGLGWVDLPTTQFAAAPHPQLQVQQKLLQLSTWYNISDSRCDMPHANQC